MTIENIILKNNLKLEKTKKKIFNQLFTFENFITGKANQLARAAALQISTNPNTTTIPFSYMVVLVLAKHI